jgi:FAD synthetase
MRKIVASCGAFDGIHAGHLNFLKIAKQYGDELYIFVVPNRVIERNKRRKPFYNQKERVQHLRKIGLVTHVIVMKGTDKDHLRQIVKLESRVYCFGKGQKDRFALATEKVLRKKNVRIIKIPRYQPHKYSTTKLSNENSSRRKDG